MNTERQEVGDSMELGAGPTRGVISADASRLYVSDTGAGRVTPVDIFNRRIVREPGKGFPVPAGDSPAAKRFDHEEQGFRGIEAQRRGRIAGREREALYGIADDTAHENIYTRHADGTRAPQ